MAPHRTQPTAPRAALAAAPRRPLVLDILVDLALLSSASLAFALSFPGFASPNGWFPLAYVALAPLFLVARRARWAATPFYGVFFGWLSYLLYNYWLGRFHPLTLFVVPPIHAAYFLALLPLLKLADAAFPVHGYAVQALLWICYERFLKTEGFLAYSYGNLGYSQWQFLPLVRTAALWGVWGVSAIVVFPSTLIGSALRDGTRRFRGQPPSSPLPWRRGRWLFAAAVGYGVAAKIDFDGAPIAGRVRRWSSRTWTRGRGRRAYAASLERLLRQSDRGARARTRTSTSWSGRRPRSCRPSTGTPGTGRAERATSSCASCASTSRGRPCRS